MVIWWMMQRAVVQPPLLRLGRRVAMLGRPCPHLQVKAKVEPLSPQHPDRMAEGRGREHPPDKAPPPVEHSPSRPDPYRQEEIELEAEVHQE